MSMRRVAIALATLSLMLALASPPLRAQEDADGEAAQIEPAAAPTAPTVTSGRDEAQAAVGQAGMTFELRSGLRVFVPPGLPIGASRRMRLATSRAALPLDIVNLLGVSLDPLRASSINPDVSGHLNRTPEGEWVALTGHTYYAHGVGHGVSMATMSDRAGVFGVTSTSQILDPR